MEPVDFICFKCKHFNTFVGGCTAFPENIPNEISVDGDHDKPLPDQGNDIVFEPKKESK